MRQEGSTAGFQRPREISSPSDCYFYHSIDLPGFGLQEGHWDLRGDIDEYLGKVQWAGKRVVDVGTASGFVSFEMERRGADVIAFDRDIQDQRDDMGLIPFADFQERFGVTIDWAIAQRVADQERLQNSFWLTHRLNNSRVRLYCGNVYDGMPDVGEVDVSFFGCILLHLRDPFLALSRFSRITKDTLIITDTFEGVKRFQDAPVMLFRPHIADRANIGTWWWVTPALYKTFLQVLGFRNFVVTRHKARHVPSRADSQMFTLVATR